MGHLISGENRKYQAIVCQHGVENLKVVCPECRAENERYLAEEARKYREESDRKQASAENEMLPLLGGEVESLVEVVINEWNTKLTPKWVPASEFLKDSPKAMIYKGKVLPNGDLGDYGLDWRPVEEVKKVVVVRRRKKS